MKEKIKWSWKLRIKKNTSRLQRNEEVIKDLKDRLENLETNFAMRGEGLEVWYDKYLNPKKEVESE